VATGGTPADRLAEAGADLVLDDLADPRPFLEFLDGWA
jgi:phosphoglycolate phosphatase-like HAD superfamily hydrolase